MLQFKAGQKTNPFRILPNKPPKGKEEPMKTINQNHSDITEEVEVVVKGSVEGQPEHGKDAYEMAGLHTLTLIAAELRTIRQLLEEKAE